jgi:hypothetical protein
MGKVLMPQIALLGLGKIWLSKWLGFYRRLVRNLGNYQRNDCFGSYKSTFRSFSLISLMPACQLVPILLVGCFTSLNLNIHLLNHKSSGYNSAFKNVPKTLALLEYKLGGLLDGDGYPGIPILSGQNVDSVSVTHSLGCGPPTPLSFRPAPRPVPLLLPHLHPVFDTPSDREMTRAIQDSTNRLIEPQSLKIQGGVKNGFKIHLNGRSGQDSNASIQGPKGHNYIITPAGAAKGENIAINRSGLYIRLHSVQYLLVWWSSISLCTHLRDTLLKSVKLKRSKNLLILYGFAPITFNV